MDLKLAQTGYSHSWNIASILNMLRKTGIGRASFWKKKKTKALYSKSLRGVSEQYED